MTRQAAGKALPPEIFHYTTLEAALSILSSKTLWASSHRFLNDRSELDYALEVMQRAAYTARGSRPLRNIGRAAYKYIGYLKDTVASRLGELYVASFCEDGDLLSQWRAYGTGEDAYALGFNLPLLAEKWRYSAGEQDVTQQVSLLKVKYADHDDRVVTKAFRDEVVKIAAMVEERTSRDDGQPTRTAEELFEMLKTPEGQEILRRESEENEPVWRSMYKEFDDYAFENLKTVLAIKHPSFREEQEWRLVLSLDEGAARPLMRFRMRGSIMVPYIPINYQEGNAASVISSVRVGPGAADLAVEAMSIFLRANGLPDVPVIRSNIPLR